MYMYICNNPPPPLPVADQVTTTPCRARLLIRSKMAQYLGLVRAAEDNPDTTTTTAADLQVRVYIRRKNSWNKKRMSLIRSKSLIIVHGFWPESEKFDFSKK